MVKSFHQTGSLWLGFFRTTVPQPDLRSNAGCLTITYTISKQYAKLIVSWKVRCSIAIAVGIATIVYILTLKCLQRNRTLSITLNNDSTANMVITSDPFARESFLNSDFYTSSLQEPCFKQYLELRCTTSLRQRAREAAYVIRAYLCRPHANLKLIQCFIESRFFCVGFKR